MKTDILTRGDLAFGNRSNIQLSVILHCSVGWQLILELQVTENKTTSKSSPAINRKKEKKATYLHRLRTIISQLSNDQFGFRGLTSPAQMSTHAAK